MQKRYNKPELHIQPYQEWWRERPDETRQPEFIKVPNPAATRDEDSIYTHIESDVRFLFFDGLLNKIDDSRRLFCPDASQQQA